MREHGIPVLGAQKPHQSREFYAWKPSWKQRLALALGGRAELAIVTTSARYPGPSKQSLAIVALWPWTRAKPAPNGNGGAAA